MYHAFNDKSLQRPPPDEERHLGCQNRRGLRIPEAALKPSWYPSSQPSSQLQSARDRVEVSPSELLSVLPTIPRGSIVRVLPGQIIGPVHISTELLTLEMDGVMITSSSEVPKPQHVQSVSTVSEARARTATTTLKHQREKNWSIPNSDLQAQPALVIAARGVAIHNLKIDSQNSVAVSIEAPETLLENCRISGYFGGIVVKNRAITRILGCTVAGCRRGTGILAECKTRMALENTTITENMHGLNVNAEATPWIVSCRFLNNRNCGAIFEDGALGAMVDCTFRGNTTQGLWIAGERTGPTIFRCDFVGGKALGAKILEKSRPHFNGCKFEANAEGDLHISDGGNPTVRHCRFLGGATQGVVVWERSGGTFDHNSFEPYSVNAMAVHAQSTVHLTANFFRTNLDYSVAMFDKDSAGNGIELGQSVSGAAKYNCFMGWKSGVVRARMAWVVPHNSHFKRYDHCMINEETLAAQPQNLVTEIYTLAKQDPNHTIVDLAKKKPIAAESKTPVMKCISSTQPALSKKKKPDENKTPPQEPLTDESAALLANVLHADGYVKTLDLSGNEITARGVGHLSLAFQAHESIEHVDFSYNCLSDEAVVELASTASKQCTLKEISVRGNDNITDEAIPAVVQTLKANANIRRFDVSGCKRLSKKSVEDVDFLCAVNEVTSSIPEARIMLLDAFSNNTTSEEMNLGEKTAEAIRTWAQEFSASTPTSASSEDGSMVEYKRPGDLIRRFRRGVNAATVNPFSILTLAAYSLRTNSFVTALHLDAMNLSTAMLTPLAEFLSAATRHNALRVVTLAHNEIDDVSALTGSIVCNRNSQLSLLDLSDNRLDARNNAEAVMALVGAGPRGNDKVALDCVNVRGNFFDPEDVDYMTNALCQRRNQGKPATVNLENQRVPPRVEVLEDDEAEEKKQPQKTLPRRILQVVQPFELRRN